MTPRLRGMRRWLNRDGKVEAVSPLLDRKPVYRPPLWMVVLMGLAWVALVWALGAPWG